MIYKFRTRREVIQHIHALCELSSSIEHSNLPISDFEHDLSDLLSDLKIIKKLSKKFTHPVKMYIAFRTTGFDSSTILQHFKSRVTSFQTSFIACYTIQFSDGFYILNKFSLN